MWLRRRKYKLGSHILKCEKMITGQKRHAGCVSSHANMRAELSPYLKNERDLVLPSYPGDIWDERCGRGFGGNPSPVYSASLNANSPAHTHSALSD